MNETEAALMAVLSKLLRQKYWNDSVDGHRWLKEGPLINQSPVRQPGLPAIRKHALELIPKMIAIELLLTKGSGQGKTPKEFSIYTKFLPAIKQAVSTHSLQPLIAQAELSTFMRPIVQHNSPRNVNVLDCILNGSAIENCRETRTAKDQGS